MKPNPPSKKLLDQLSDQLRIKHYSSRTEQTYIAWVRRFILFHNKKHPLSMGAPEINAFIDHLAIDGKLAASTHTVLAVGARGIKPSAPSSFSIATF